MTHETRKQAPLKSHKETEHLKSNGQTQLNFIFIINNMFILRI